MSADNYILVVPHNGGWVNQMLFASVDDDDGFPPISENAPVYSTVFEALKAANQEEVLEYGVTLSPDAAEAWKREFHNSM